MPTYQTIQSWITLRARETVALGRELLGGNGIISDFLVAKVFTFSLNFGVKLYKVLTFFFFWFVTGFWRFGADLHI